MIYFSQVLLEWVHFVETNIEHHFVPQMRQLLIGQENYTSSSPGLLILSF